MRTTATGGAALAMLWGLSLQAFATNHQIQIDEVMGSCDGDTGIQFIEIGFPEDQNKWAGCAQLRFFDATGVQTGTFVFSRDPLASRHVNSALIATRAFAELPGAPIPDFTMPGNIVSPAGQVCFTNLDLPDCFEVDLCLSYGDFAGFSPGGAPAPALPSTGVQSLQRSGADDFGTQRNADFAPARPGPTNSAGVTTPVACPDRERIRQGARLFFQETFAGNGRTCGTCHPAANSFTLDPTFIAHLPPADPLFVAEHVPTLAGLEDPILQRGPRALTLENIDGFARLPMFRGTPHIFNVARTAPFGLSGEVATLAEFVVGAVRQHFPKTLGRTSGVDFRLPTAEEVDAMVAFMESVASPRDQVTDPDQFVRTAAEQRGRDLFFGAAKCAECHGGPTFAEALGGGNQSFNTGVVRLPANSLPPGCAPPCPPLGSREAGGTREFSTPTLLNLRNTAPYFHDNSVATLHEAVAFYDSRQFNESPAAALVGGVQLRVSEIEDLVAFLLVLSPCGNGVTDHGEECDDGNRRAGNGCRPDCTREECGDGILDPGEECDDANDRGEDGCSAECKVEDSDTCDDDDACPPPPPSCGNGAIESGERCDDGNGRGGDCCSAACEVEDGSPCDDGDACTRVDVCSGASCIGHDPVVCAPPDACHGARCEPADGTCQLVATECPPPPNPLGCWSTTEDLSCDRHDVPARIDLPLNHLRRSIALLSLAPHRRRARALRAQGRRALAKTTKIIARAHARGGMPAVCGASLDTMLQDCDQKLRDLARGGRAHVVR